MTKELSIKDIKKAIIDKLKNNREILNYFKKYWDRLGLSPNEIYSSLIYDYDKSNKGSDYITVEVAEYETSKTMVNDNKSYHVCIKMGLCDEEYLDDMASKVKDIIVELFPNRKKCSNVPFYTKEDTGWVTDGIYRKEYDKLHRMISLNIDSDDVKGISINEDGDLTISGNNINIVGEVKDDPAEDLKEFLNNCQECIDRCKGCSCNIDVNEFIEPIKNNEEVQKIIKNIVADSLFNK